LAFTVPRPTAFDLQTFYQDKYFRRSDPSSVLGYADYDGDSWASINAARTWDDLGEWGPETRNVAHTLLDIGAATGEFGARAAADGWDVTACEVGDTAREKASAKGLNTVASLDEVVGQFGLITMFHVLEHVIDPAETLADARLLVAPNGLLAIELPQWRSAGRLVRRARWAQLRPPEHINFFTRSSLAAALGSSGWEVVRSSTPYPRAASLAWAGLRDLNVKQVVVQSACLALGGTGFGGYLRVVARPV
jgi:SAM-dependent methyltransferase